MNLHLAEISRTVSPGAHCVLTLDGAGWHQTGGDLVLPDNISLRSLPLAVPASERLGQPRLCHRRRHRHRVLRRLEGADRRLRNNPQNRNTRMVNSGHSEGRLV